MAGFLDNFKPAVSIDERVKLDCYIDTEYIPPICLLQIISDDTMNHGLRTPREEIAFTARPKIQSQSQIF